MKKFIFALIILFIFALPCYGVWLLLPKVNCCDKVDKEYAAYEALVYRAEVTGDVVAYKELYESSKAAGHLSEAHRWARSGAMAGSEELTQQYVLLYKGSSRKTQLYDEEIILRNIDRKKGARLLAEKLGLPNTPETSPRRTQSSKAIAPNVNHTASVYVGCVPRTFPHLFPNLFSLSFSGVHGEASG